MQTFRSFKITSYHILFCLVLILGIFARVWGFGSLPAGMAKDEAMIGVDAYTLYHYGVDRFGNSYPVHLSSYGTGQNVLYAYILIPFIALRDLTPLVVRLPMLIVGILSLPLLYLIARHISDRKYALIAMFLLAINPWHIVLSHWALESNLLPFVFMIGFACLLKSRRHNWSFILACLFFGLCYYAYGTAYVAVTIFMVAVLIILLRYQRVCLRNLVLGMVLFVLVALPVGLFVLVNLFHWDTLHLGPVTIPRLPGNERWTEVSIISENRQNQSLVGNMVGLASLLWSGSDGLASNSVEPYGYFYPYIVLVALLGLFMLLKYRTVETTPDRLLLISWFAAAIVVGIMQHPVNLNRINLVFIPLILFIAVVLAWLEKNQKIAFIISICALLVGFVFFNRDYHSEAYRQSTRKIFYADLIPALIFARDVGRGPICVTGEIGQPYIFALFAEKMDPGRFIDSVVYQEGQLDEVLSFGRYTFGIENCSQDNATIYVLSGGRSPDETIGRRTILFKDFQVLFPKGK
jgi:4-amino-4-deoxy-L-arabinose transferase-like glycosyltransferase